MLTLVVKCLNEVFHVAQFQVQDKLHFSLHNGSRLKQNIKFNNFQSCMGILTPENAASASQILLFQKLAFWSK